MIRCSSIQLRRRVCTTSYPWSFGHDVANMDRVRDHAGYCYGSCILQDSRPEWYPGVELAPYAWKCEFGFLAHSGQMLRYIYQAGVPALFLALQVFFCPESPRWYMLKGRYREAFESLARLRPTKIQAGRDLYCG